MLPVGEVDPSKVVPHIVVVSRSDGRRFIRSVRPSFVRARFSRVSSVEEISDLPPENRAINGVLVDVPRADLQDSEKLLLEQLGKAFPVLCAKNGWTSLDWFVRQCRSFLARPARRPDRIDAHLPVLVVRPADALHWEGTRATTANVSLGGCFISSEEDWEVDALLYLTFPVIPEVPSVYAQVCWITPWPQPGRLPGIGCRFLHLSAPTRVRLLCAAAHLSAGQT